MLPLWLTRRYAQSRDIGLPLAVAPFEGRSQALGAAATEEGLDGGALANLLAHGRLDRAHVLVHALQRSIPRRENQQVCYTWISTGRRPARNDALTSFEPRLRQRLRRRGCRAACAFQGQLCRRNIPKS